MLGFSSHTVEEPTLTALPSRLSLRSKAPSAPPTTAASIFTVDEQHTPPTRPSSVASHARPGRRDSAVAEDASEWGASGFAGLLSRDPRLSVDVCDAVDDHHDARMLALPGAGVAVAGPDAGLLIHEMHRAHLSAAQHRRRRLALWAGFLTLIVLVCTVWFVVETVWALVTAGARGRGVVRWAELAGGLLAAHCCLAVVPWLRTRRPNRLSLPTLGLAILAFGLHLVLAVANVVLVVVWRSELATRCTWGVDVAWTMRRSGSTCEGNRWTGWVVAAALRLIISVLVGFAWLMALRAFWRCLRISSIIDPSLAPSSEAQAILARHSAGIVPLSAHSHFHLAPHADLLPHFTDRSAHYAFVSESTSYAHTEGEGSPASAGVGTWLGAKVMGAVGWLMGIDSYEKAQRGEDEDVEKGEKQAMLLREGRGSEGMPGQRMSGVVDPRSMRVYAPADLDNPEIRQVDAPRPLASSAAASDAERYRGLFGDLARSSRARGRSNSQPEQRLLRPQSSATFDSSLRSLSPDPADDDHYHLHAHAQLHHQYLAAQHEEDDDDPVAEKDLPAPPPPPHSRTGSSGSTGGSLVYVRMSDGRLVRKLSTIASEGSEATSSGGGWRAGSSADASGGRKSASASWATALERDEEVLAEGAEMREVESRAGGWESRSGA